MSDWSRSCVTSRKVALACRPFSQRADAVFSKRTSWYKRLDFPCPVLNNNYEIALYNLWFALKFNLFLTVVVLHQRFFSPPSLSVAVFA